MARPDGSIVVHPGPRTIAAVPNVDDWLNVPPAIRLRTRPKWPAGMPVTVYASADTWWPSWIDDEEHVTWTARDESGNHIEGESPYRMYFAVDPRLKGRVTVEGTIKVFQSHMYHRQEPQRQVFSTPIRFEYDTVGSIDDIMEPVSSPVLDSFLTSSVTAVATESVMQFTVTQPVPPGFDDVAFAAVLEVLANERIIMTAHIRGPSVNQVLEGRWTTYGNVDYTDNDADAARLRRGQADPSWRLRMRTDPQGALSELKASRYWKGEVTIPLTVGKYDPRVRLVTPPPTSAPTQPPK